MKTFFAFAAALTLVPSIVQAGPPQHVLTQPYTWQESFEGAALGQFASYPPVQDVGYDPSLEPTSDYGAPGGRSLMRILKPVRTGAERFGFIRRLDLISSPDASLSFSYRLEAPASNDRIEIGIAAGDGRRYVTAIPVGSPRAWHIAQVPLNRLRSDKNTPLAAGVAIEGLYVVAALPKALPDVTYRFLIDDLSLRAAREVRFDVRVPRTKVLEPRRDLFAATALAPGRTIEIEAFSPIQLKEAACALKTQDGNVVTTATLYDDGTHGDRTSGDNIWTNHNVAGAKTPGVYELELSGVTRAGLKITTSVRALEPGRVPAAHPRLFFTANDREKFIERSRSAKYSELWKLIVQRAAQSRDTGDLRRGAAIVPMLDRQYLLPTLPGYFDLISKAGARIQYNALVAYLTGSAEAREAARSALLAVMEWKSWEPPWFPAHGQATYYPAGELTAQVAFAYDLLYDRLSPAERKIIREGLVQKGIAPAYREYVEDDRILANTSNWIAHSVAGSLLASAAIAGDGPDSDLNLYTNGLTAKLEAHLSASYLRDGSYGESISYQEFDLETLAPALVALQNVFGIDYWSRSYVKDSLWYPIATLADPVSGCLDMGDTHCPSGRTIAPVVRSSRNPVFRWYEDLLKPQSIEEFLFADEELAPKPPDEPGSRYFADKGAVVFRTGWKPEDSVLLFRAGPNFNHNHAGQGGFLFRALGETLATEAGYSDYYKDPYYDSYFKQAAGHNTVLVSGDPASQEVADTLAFPALHQYPVISNVITSTAFDGATSELEQVYRGRLKKFTRRLVFIKPDYVIVCDELVPAQKESFDWLLHLPDRSRVRAEENTALYNGQNASLAVRFLSPSALTLRIGEGHLPFSVFNPVAPARVPMQPAILNARTAASAEPVAFLTALAPARTSQAAREKADALRAINAPAWTGVSGAQGTLLFRRASAQTMNTFDSWTTDADTWLFRGEPERPELLAAMGVTNVKRANETWFSSERTASFSAAYENGRVSLNVYSAEPQRVRVRETGGGVKEFQVEAGSSKLEWREERSR